MSVTLRRLSLVAALLALPLHDAAAQRREQVTLRGPEVAVYNVVGTLRVVAGTGREVVVDIVRQGRDADRLEVLDGEVRGRPTVRVTTREERLVYPALGWRNDVNGRVRDDGTFGDEGSGWPRGRSLQLRGHGRGPEAWADVTVAVPAGQKLAVHLLAGEATVRNVDGDLVVDVAAAAVTTAGTRGRLLVDAGSGAVRIADAEGDVDVDAGSGSVELTDVRATRLRVDGGSGALRGSGVAARALDLDLGSGSTRLSRVSARTLRLDSGSGSVDLELLDQVDDVRIDSGSGSVTLRVPAAFGATLDVDTGSGGIESELPLTISRRERGHLSGRIGDGKGRVVIDTGSGSVRILRS